jgi:hypothetical protein
MGFVETVMEIIGSILYVLIWIPVRWSVSFLWKFLRDVFSNVYVRVVTAVGGLIYAYILFGAHTLFQ